ncbi:hypothetical protein C0991_004729 [Blastosporella zonata]|nr:hypothetical protein C0991_004729 [Blastosporella zonata]
MFCKVISIIGVYVPITSDDVHATVNGVATGALFGCSGMYPLVVILLISKQRSEIESFGFSTALQKHGGPNPDVELQNIDVVAPEDVASPAQHDEIVIEARAAVPRSPQTSH